MYEVYLARRAIGAKDWDRIIRYLLRLSRQGEKIELVFRFDDVNISIYLKIKEKLAPCLAGINGVLIRNCEEMPKEIKAIPVMKMKFAKKQENMIEIAEKMQAYASEPVEMRAVFVKIWQSFAMRVYWTEQRNGKFYIWRQMDASLELLDLDFGQRYLLKKMPK